MKPAFRIALLTLALGASCALADPRAALESEPLDAVVYGVVESVRETPLPEERAALAGVLEHSVKPETADEIQVRLDDGRAITVVQDTLQRVAAGERVVVIRERRGARIESVLPM